MHGLDDRLAELLWAARVAATKLSPSPDWASLTPERARRINELLVARVVGEGRAAWKMGAFDEETRLRLGLDEPLVSAVLPDRLHVGVDDVRLDLAGLVQPKLEPEIGISVDGEGVRITPCVEVADCRFPSWQLPPAAAVADFGLQGAMIFGHAASPVLDVQVTVRRNGEPVTVATGSWSESVTRLDLLPPTRPASYHVATGALTPLLDATPGRWQFEFRDIGTVTLVLS